MPIRSRLLFVLIALFLFAAPAAWASCPEPTASALSPNLADRIWIDDATPTGATFYGSRVSSQASSGASSMTNTNVSGSQYYYVTGATDTLHVGFGETLIVDLLVSECHTPTRVSLQWVTTDSITKTVTLGTPLTGTLHLGSLPTPGVWTRIEIPALTLGLELKDIGAFAVYQDDGQSWADAVGVQESDCAIATASQPALVTGDSIWVDDALPTGATLGLGQWDDSQSASGTQSLTRYNKEDEAAFGFDNATTPLQITFGQGLIAYTLINECRPPSRIMVQWVLDDNTYFTASWGEAMNNTLHMGDVPAAGEWTRLEVPAWKFNMEWKNVKGVYFYVYDGHAWFDAIGTSAASCVPDVAEAVTVPVTGNMTWFHDAPPAGAGVANNPVWDAWQKTLGSYSLTRYPFTPDTWWGVTNATTTMPVKSGETLWAYALVNECRVPESFLVQWLATDDTVGTANWGTPINGTYHVDDLPEPGEWTRLEVPASAVGLVGKTIKSVYFYQYEGQVWIDGVGRTCTAMSPSPVTTGEDDTVWIDDDTLPAGATANGDLDDTYAATGTYSFTKPMGEGEVAYGVSDATAPLHVGFGEDLFAYVLVSDCHRPTRILLQWLTTDNVMKTASWGEPLNNTTHMGDVPPSGVWTRLEVDAQSMGLEFKDIKTFYFYQYDGQAWFDTVGKIASSCTPAIASSVTIPSTDDVWIDDTLPTGSVYAGQWDTTQKASGTQSFTRTDAIGEVAYGVQAATPTMSISSGDVLTAYVLVNECRPPTRFLVQWILSDNTYRTASWGATMNGTLHIGDIPTGGEWTRLEVEADDLDMAGKTVNGIFFYQYDGQVSFDAIGKTP